MLCEDGYNGTTLRQLTRQMRDPECFVNCCNLTINSLGLF